MHKLSRYALLSSTVFLSFAAYSAERVFYEDMEYTNFVEHFMERSYGTAYQEYWDLLLNGPANVTQSTDAYSGSHSMCLNLFAPAHARSIGVGETRFGNTSNFDLSSAITGTKVLFRWKQKFQPGADWGGYNSKQIYLNYKDQGDFVFTLVKRHDYSWMINVHTNSPYEYTLNEYFQGSTNIFDGQWHNMEVFLDWTGQEDVNGGSCVATNRRLNFDSTDGNGIVRFRIDGVTQYEKTNTCFYTDPVSGPSLHHIGWPSNLSGSGGSGEQTTWIDDLEIWDDQVSLGDSHRYTILNPDLVSSAVVSLSDNNVITAGGTTLNLDRYEWGAFYSNTGALTQGVVVTGTGPFEMGSAENATDMPVHASLAGTQFVMPHSRYSHLYYMVSPDEDATAYVNVNGTQNLVTLPQGNVVEFDAGETNGNISTIITSDMSILASHRGDPVSSSWFADASPIPPAATELWGIRSGGAHIGAVEDNTHVTLYASNGTSSTTTLNAGERRWVNVGLDWSSSTQGRGSAIHLVADKPIGAIQLADGDGAEQTAFLPTSLLNTRFGLPKNAQYIAVACPEESTNVTLYNGNNAPITRACNANGNYPGKAYFGSADNGTVGAQQGAYLESNKPIHVIYEVSDSQEEHNLMGTRQP